MRMLRVLLAVVLATTGAMATLVVPAAQASAADLSLFDPGNIISDAIFYDSTAMSAAQVDAFVQARGASCVPSAGNTCLKSYRETTWTRPADTRCTGTYTGAASETAAQIITKVAVACGINPQVLLVTLQKEQGLVTATAGRSAEVYRKAMGYGCPDTSACDSQYYGFFNQVYSAARQFQNYAKNPGGYAHRPGTVNQVRYSPDATCGASAVYIANQATAGLYNYTPYQPNAAALAAGYGTGDGCSAYGNRNFWNYFTDWFGSTTQRAPIGSLDSVTSPAVGTFQVSGWTLDPDTTASIQVHVYVDGVAVGVLTANTSRPDVGAAYGRGSAHGFVGTVGATQGTHQVCVYGIDATGGSNAGLGCGTVTVQNSPPVGSLDSVTAPAVGTIAVSGWALDPDTADPISVHVYVDGVGAAVLTASTSRPDVAAAYGKGANHGYSATVGATNGTHQVCTYGIDTAGAGGFLLGCRSVTVVNHAPVGSIDSVTPGVESIAVSGWALDPDTADPISVHVYVDGVGAAVLTASTSRPDVAAAYGKGANHGYSATVGATNGTHQVCTYGIDTAGAGGFLLGCRSVTVVNQAPIGSLDSGVTGMESLTVSGWALDPDSAASVTVNVLVDGVVAGTATAAIDRPDVAAAYGKGAAHGYSVTVPAAAGPRRVCVQALDTRSGPSTQVGCTTVDVNGTAFGKVDSVTVSAGRVQARGWAIDPNTAEPIAVHMYVDQAGFAATADVSRPDVGAAYGKGDAHGFDISATVAAGQRTVCLYAIDSWGGSNPLLGCSVVTVP